MPQELDKQQLKEYHEYLRRLFTDTYGGSTTFDKNVPPPPSENIGTGRVGDFAAPKGVFDNYVPPPPPSRAYQMGGSATRGLYSGIERLMKHGYTPGTNDTEGVDNAANIGLQQAFGGMLRSANPANAGELGVGGGRPPRMIWTQDKVDKLMELAETHGVGKNGLPIIHKYFKDNYGYEGAPGSLQSKASQIKMLGGASKTTGLDPIVNPAPGGNPGVPGVPYKDLSFLQEHSPATPEWVRNWAKGAKLGMEETTAKDSPSTKYITLTDPVNPETSATVRAPRSPDQHAAPEASAGELRKGFYDLGYPNWRLREGAPTFPGDNGTPRLNPGMPYRGEPNPTQFVTEANLPYSDRSVLDKALTLRFSKNKNGEFELVSPDYAPYPMPTPGPSQQPKTYNPYKDPRQGNLFSTEDILKALQGGGQ